MARKTDHMIIKTSKSQTLPSSPTHSLSSTTSSDFEFTISLPPPPNKSSSTTTATTTLCPADDLFYKGQLLPLHLSPRLSMVRTLLLASSSTSSSSTTTTTTPSRDSSGSSTDSNCSSDLLLDCDSSRPSSVVPEDNDDFKRLNNNKVNKNKYFSLSRFSSVFRKESKDRYDSNHDNVSGGSSVKRISVTAKEVIRKYMKKVKPLYEKLSQKQQQKMKTRVVCSGNVSFCMKMDGSLKNKGTGIIDNQKGGKENTNNVSISHSFSGNLRYPRKRSCVSSCPSSMRSSPSHSGILSRNVVLGTSTGTSRVGGGMCYADTSSMEELQSAIQGAIAHCKNSMLQNKTMVSDENGEKS